MMDKFGKKYCLDCETKTPTGDHGMCLLCWPEQVAGWRKWKWQHIKMKRIQIKLNLCMQNKEITLTAVEA